MHKCKIGLGGGCHWCTEAIFLSVAGVLEVEQGWVASNADNTAFSEAVVVHFDADKINLDILISIHLHTHSSRSAHSMRHKYRSAVYSFSNTQHQAAVDCLSRLQAMFKRPLVTEVMPCNAFRVNQQKYRNYYYSNPDRPFCQSVIAGKIQILRDRFPTDINVPASRPAAL